MVAERSKTLITSRVEPVDLVRGERILTPIGGSGTGENGHPPGGEADIKPQVEFVGEPFLHLRGEARGGERKQNRADHRAFHEDAQPGNLPTRSITSFMRFNVSAIDLRPLRGAGSSACLRLCSAAKMVTASEAREPLWECGLRRGV